ncbi:MAG: biotin/lipoyl-containing protein, partial [Candidatus Nanopelagicales bacterium]
MSVEVKLPALGESVTEGTVTRWLKNVGDVVAADEPLLEVSTDKVDTEIPAPAAGVIVQIAAPEDAVVEVGGLLCVIGTESEAVPPPVSAPQPPATPVMQPPSAPSSAPAPAAAPPTAAPPTAAPPVGPPQGGFAPPPQVAGSTAGGPQVSVAPSGFTAPTGYTSPTFGAPPANSPAPSSPPAATPPPTASAPATPAPPANAPPAPLPPAASQPTVGLDQAEGLAALAGVAAGSAATTAAAPQSGYEVTLPALGESVTEGTVTRWLKAVGDEVAMDEPLLEVSTDKVDTEIPSPAAGILQEIRVAEDETAEVGAVLAVVGAGAPAATEPAATEPPAAAPAVTPPVPARAATPEPRDETGVADAVPHHAAAPGSAPTASAPASAASAAAPAAAAAAATGAAVYVTPLVRKLARDAGIDIAEVQGSGVGGRIRREDVQAAVAARSSAAPTAPAA